ncbi:hypothetical protein SBD_2337 [Streptomyces bottropensis ATCC 25435]|uniref:Uncharacterized protein n=1 Tax=Streptomyces bottropensis ATCC 25435 TaxID=1054862 RepID=M3FTM1_9ACTN|nr:hypothetical protein SBD_2337 [Streptomyces bottropensis ATCC 25435]
MFDTAFSLRLIAAGSGSLRLSASATCLRWTIFRSRPERAAVLNSIAAISNTMGITVTMAEAKSLLILKSTDGSP